MSLTGGFGGVLSGGLVVALLRAVRFELDNRLLQTHFGGGRLQQAFSPVVALAAVLTAVAIGVLSSHYLIALALRLTPVLFLAQQ